MMAGKSLDERSVDTYGGRAEVVKTSPAAAAAADSGKKTDWHKTVMERALSGAPVRGGRAGDDRG
jgi:hypothetical protein